MPPVRREPSGRVFDTCLANSLLHPLGVCASLGALTKTGFFLDELCSLLTTKRGFHFGSVVGNLGRSRHSNGRADASMNVRSWPTAEPTVPSFPEIPAPAHFGDWLSDSQGANSRLPRSTGKNGQN